MRVYVLLLALFFLVQTLAQNSQACRELATDCFELCYDKCNPGDTQCRKACKMLCVNEYTCGNTREVWSDRKTEWCCACTGQRCSATG
jgi:hypothetical protein